tara:strand:+ start:1529 stop:2059 length:531 start_codon:yes stop_codon:yes gene_type:complete
MANFDTATINWSELSSIIKDLNKIATEVKRGKSKVKKILKTAAKPLRDEMKNLAPKYKKAKKGSKRKAFNKDTGKSEWIKYKTGSLKRSVASWHTKRGGLFVAPRIGKLHSKVLGKPNLDGWYAHLALAPHKIRGGGKTSNHQSPHFIERARLSKRQQVLKLIAELTKKEIEKHFK